MSVKDRIKFNRKRLHIRNYITVKNTLILTSIVIVLVASISIVGGILLTNKVKNTTVVYKGEADNTVSESEKEENQQAVETIGNQAVEQEDKKTSSGLSLCILGEIMMGGEVTNQLNYQYATAFKKIYAKCNSADFTYANFSTNITNLDKIENAKSKYLVTKEVMNGLQALGLDSVSIASDHMMDFDGDIFKNTITTLEKNDIFVAGRQNTPVYFEKGNVKIAIVSTNAVILGTSKQYTKNEISVYEKDNLIKNIKEAKQSADVVIADIHWGKEYVYGVTDQMRQIAAVAVDSGADMVMGSHAVGVYPMEQYNGKPILYSTGYLIGDSELYVAKEGFIFTIHIAENKKIDKIEMAPTYIKDKKEVIPYPEFDPQKASSYVAQFNTWQQQNGLNSTIQDGNISITLP